MKSRKVVVFPRYQKIWDQLGENIKLARKRRKLTAIQLAERAAIERVTLRKIERICMKIFLNWQSTMSSAENFRT